MKINYDSSLKLAGIAIVPWNRLGPEQFLSNYAIGSLYDWDAPVSPDLPRLVSLAASLGQAPRLSKYSTAELLDHADFQRLLETELAGYDLLTYRPVALPASLAGRKVLMVDEAFAKRFENKVEFRQMFADTLPFPDFKIWNRSELAVTQESYDAVIGTYPKIIQDEQLSGGKGSFVVRNFEDYAKALDSLRRMSKHSRVVVSELLENARERTIQGCVTKAGVLTGPLQRQVVAHPVLANRAVAEGDKFCGAQILASDQGSDTHKQAAELAQIIGQKLAQQGYKGIFGVDFLLDDQNRLKVLEVNPRLTGVTPLLTALFKGENAIPFYLLHILELGGYDYEITDDSYEFNGSGALLIMHALETYPVQIVATPSSGTYAVVNMELQRVSDNIDLKRLEQGQFIIEDYMAAGMTIKPGGRILTIQFNEQILDENTDELYNNTLETITAIQRQLELKPASKEQA